MAGVSFASFLRSGAFIRSAIRKYVFIDGKQADPLENRSIRKVARRGPVKDFRPTPTHTPKELWNKKKRIKSDGGIITINKDFSPLFGNLN